MTKDDILQGWGQIEWFTGLTRNTLRQRGYPIQKDGGTVWASKGEILQHKLSNSVNLRQIPRESVKES